jgi:microcystin-dependent protein
MTDPFVAEIRIFPFNFAPTGWAMCNGQLLPISQNTALFSLLGTTYGGNGQSTFALPNLQGSAPMHTGQGPGLSQRVLGQMSGTTAVTLLQSEIPQHTHALNAQNAPGDTSSPAGNAYARAIGATPYQPPGGAQVAMAPQAVGVTGGSQPHNNMQPYLTLNFCIALQGIFPPRP